MTLAGLMGILIAAYAVMWMAGIFVYLFVDETTDSGYPKPQREEGDNRLRWKLRESFDQHGIDVTSSDLPWPIFKTGVKLSLFGLIFGILPLLFIVGLFFLAAQVKLF